jgi:8-oxo-dGTP diphosphatase
LCGWWTSVRDRIPVTWTLTPPEVYVNKTVRYGVLVTKGRYPHATVQLAVDLAILTVREDRLQVLTIERGNEPFRGRLALPGGFLRDGESLWQAAERELAEETGLEAAPLHLEQLATYGAPDRDPRTRVISVTYLALAPDLPIPTAGSDAASAAWMPVAEVTGRLAFDHDQILHDAVERARHRLEYTTLAAVFCPATFTMGDLRKVYEVVWGMALDPRNFNRKVLNTAGFVLPTQGKRVQETGRPAALYRRGPATTLYPAMLREKESSR